MTEDRSTPRRVHSLLATARAVIEANRRHLLADAAAVVAWAAILVLAFGALGGPRWLFYSLLVGGIVTYTLAREPLTGPGEE
ncbi:hypothetical protein G9C85_08700 [Halorubellus sp. JP-L1]|uniref:hypothetical protein n=1 Tax=Halorubellus sp. JP-L1 TaxID=2715753 RepID=UPI00140B6906|nr:hypothetical protein [Halorubellus sp. JP-L1]NHN41709.1 hypothetical protein [Halorubellus sp. JP-L1]